MIKTNRIISLFLTAIILVSILPCVCAEDAITAETPFFELLDEEEEVRKRPVYNQEALEESINNPIYNSDIVDFNLDTTSLSLQDSSQNILENSASINLPETTSQIDETENSTLITDNADLSEESVSAPEENGYRLGTYIFR